MNFLSNPARNRPLRRMALVGLLVAPALATAAPATIVPAEVVIHCQQIQLPSQRAVAELLQIDNLGQAYRARAHLMEDAKRACNRSGVARVRLLGPGAVEHRTAGVN